MGSRAVPARLGRALHIPDQLHGVAMCRRPGRRVIRVVTARRSRQRGSCSGIAHVFHHDPQFHTLANFISTLHHSFYSFLSRYHISCILAQPEVPKSMPHDSGYPATSSPAFTPHETPCCTA